MNILNPTELYVMLLPLAFTQAFTTLHCFTLVVPTTYKEDSVKKARGFVMCSGVENLRENQKGISHRILHKSNLDLFFM